MEADLNPPKHLQHDDGDDGENSDEDVDAENDHLAETRISITFLDDVHHRRARSAVQKDETHNRHLKVN